MARVSVYFPPIPTPLAPRPASPGFDFQQDRSSRQCSPASSVGSHASGISHPPGTRKRRRITLRNVSSSELLTIIADWDDGQDSRPSLSTHTSPDERGLFGTLSSPSEESSPLGVEHSDLDSLMPLFPMNPPSKLLSGTSSSRDEDDYASLLGPPLPFSQSVPIVPVKVDLESGLRSQAKKRKANNDASRRFRNRRKNEAALEQRISHLTEQLRTTTEQRDSYHSERNISREKLGHHVGTRRIPVRPASPCNYTSTLGQSDSQSLPSSPNSSTLGQSDSQSLPSSPNTSNQSDPIILMTDDLKSKSISQAEKRKANRDASRRFRNGKKNKAALEQRISHLTEQLQSTTEQRDFYRSERAFFREEVSRHVGTEQGPSHPASPCNDRSRIE